jgi:hypothetical protein
LSQLAERIRTAKRRELLPEEVARLLTWPRLIQLARGGEPQLLCDFLKSCDGRLSSVHFNDLANLIVDALAGNLKRPSHRVKMSPQTRAHVLCQRYQREAIVAAQLREVERRQGKQLRGERRNAAFRNIIAELPPAFRSVKLEHLAEFTKLTKSRRR